MGASVGMKITVLKVSYDANIFKDNFVCLLKWNSDKLHFLEHCKVVSKALLD